jgi:hypothetical protein
MSDAKQMMARAADLLRESASTEDGAVALSIAISAFMGVHRVKTDKEDGATLAANIMRRAAELLSPTCPHCGKHIELPSTVGDKP